MESSLADDIADKSWATNFSHSLAVAQDIEDAMEALIHFQLSELFDISLHNKKFTWKTNNDFAIDITMLYDTLNISQVTIQPLLNHSTHWWKNTNSSRTASHHLRICSAFQICHQKEELPTFQLSSTIQHHPQAPFSEFYLLPAISTNISQTIHAPLSGYKDCSIPNTSQGQIWNISQMCQTMWKGESQLTAHLEEPWCLTVNFFLRPCP